MKLTAIAKEDLEAKGLKLSNTVRLSVIGNAIPDFYGEQIGRLYVEKGEMKSYFTADEENGNLDEFNKTKENVTVIERAHNVYNFETNERSRVVDYFVPYAVQESSMNRPTITNNHVENVCNGHYECEFELLLTCDEATRRIVIPYSTVNIPMLGLLEDLEENVREILDGECDDDNPLKTVININGDEGYGMMTMFDEIGLNYDIEVASPEEFIAMIVSVRQIKCEFVESKPGK